MGKAAHGKYKIKFPEKYLGDPNKVEYRSSWELAVFSKLDSNHPYIMGWGSEILQIPYVNPLVQNPSKKWSMYVPDLFVVYMDRDQKKHAEVIEIKPYKETPGGQKITKTGTVTRLTEAEKRIQMVNACKWDAAIKFCKKNGFEFRVFTEETLFNYERRK